MQKLQGKARVSHYKRWKGALNSAHFVLNLPVIAIKTISGELQTDLARQEVSGLSKGWRVADPARRRDRLRKRLLLWVRKMNVRER